MKLSKLLLAFVFSCFALQSFATTLANTTPSDVETVIAQDEQIKAFAARFSNMTAEDFSNISASDLEEMTGRKLSLKEKIAFKVAKKKMAKMQKKAAKFDAGSASSAPGVEKNVYILLAILIPFLAVGMATNWEGSDWIICLVLTFICWLPGFIYALAKMKNYYGS